MKLFEEFKKFAFKGNVVDLAVGFILGAAFTTIVNSLVNDIIMPSIAMLTGGLDFQNWFVTLRGDHFRTLEEAKAAGAATLNYGLFINAIINFLLVAVALFLVVKGYLSLEKKEEIKEEEKKAEERKCPFCKTLIDDAATRCPNCTSELGGVVG